MRSTIQPNLRKEIQWPLKIPAPSRGHVKLSLFGVLYSRPTWLETPPSVNSWTKLWREYLDHLALAASRLLQAGLTNIHKPTETSCRWLASQTDRQTKMAMNSCLKWEPAQANVYYYIIVKYRFHFTTNNSKLFFVLKRTFILWMNLLFLLNINCVSNVHFPFRLLLFFLQ